MIQIALVGLRIIVQLLCYVRYVCMSVWNAASECEILYGIHFFVLYELYEMYELYELYEQYE